MVRIRPGHRLAQMRYFVVCSAYPGKFRGTALNCDRPFPSISAETYSPVSSISSAMYAQLLRASLDKFQINKSVID
jgi:hypothetical protein